MTRPQLQDTTVVMGESIPRFGMVPIHMVSLPDNHCGMDMAQVQVYTELLLEGQQLPPVLIMQDGDRCWLIDGRHRFLAHIIAGRNVIGAVVSSTIELI